MFSAGRYVVVDDELDELRLLVDTLHSVGTPCVGVHYTGKPLNRTIFSGVRILFSDLHLVPGSSSKKVHFSAIESMLRNNVVPSAGGPYILIVWTSHDEEVAELRDYLHQNLDPALRPLAVLELDKKPFLAGGSNQEALAAAVHAQINQSAEIRALMSWEIDVLAAASATLAAVTDLVPNDQRDPVNFSAGLNRILSLLAVANAGKKNVEADRRGAINGVLAPILADRIMNAPLSADVSGIWDQAITRHKEAPELDDARVGRINTMLHIAMPPAEAPAPTDWGTVLTLPAAELTDAAMRERFGLTYAEMADQLFLLSKAERKKSTLVVIRIGAICDHAQRKPGPIPYVAGILVPADIGRADDAKILKSELEGPILLLDEAVGPVRLYVNARMQIAMVTPPADWPVLFRVREQLLTMISAHCSDYQSRPGVVKLPS